jgi:hypothetical protein
MYDQPFYVADAEAEGAWSDRDITGNIAERTFCLAFPVRERGMFRLIGVVPEALRIRTDLTFDDLRNGFARREPDVEGLRAYLGRFEIVASRGEGPRGPNHAS